MLEILLLGPVEAWAGAVRVPLAPLERDLLALLALQPGTVSSTDRIIDGLWGERPPAAPRSRVQGLVSGLRRKVGAALVTRQPGYLLDVPSEAVDSGRCEALARQVRAARTPAEKAKIARLALGLWRGEALDGACAPGADPDRARLAELRVGLMEQCFEAELALGQHAEVVGELASAVSAYPLRERLVLLSMTALYKCSRQADAVRTYVALQERLEEELGAEPCPEVRELRALILRGEPLPDETPPARPDGASGTAPAGAVVPRPRTASSQRPAVEQPAVGIRTLKTGGRPAATAHKAAAPKPPATPRPAATPQARRSRRPAPTEPVSDDDGAATGATPQPAPSSLTAPPPAQMPASSGHFLGRDSDLAALTAALPGPRDEPRVLVVSGAGGLGKTALVVRWAHAVADRFPDGQIFVGLRPARASGPPQAGTALGAVLLALGVSADKLPVSTEERAALYRTMVHRRRVLVVADDVQAVGQLLPLVPPTPGSLIVATSRSRLTALSIHHAVRTLTIEPLGPDPSLELLSAIVGAERLRGEGVAELVELCGGWPLALRIAGATLAARAGQSPASFAEELRERIDTLTVAGDPRTVRAALAEARDGLEPAAARLFAQLGVLPGDSVCLQLAAAAAGVSVLRARRLLDELISANLVVETGPDRYRLHDMVLRYARHCGAELPDRDVVEERVARWYVRVFEACSRQTAPDGDTGDRDGGTGPAWLRDPGRELPAGGPRALNTAGPAEWLPFAGEDADLFLDFERGNVAPVARWLAGRGDDELTWRFIAHAYAADPAVPAEVCRLGLAAATRLDDPRALGAAHAQLGVALLADPALAPEADWHLTVAVEQLESDASRLHRAASFALGRLRARQRRPHEARAAMEHTLGCLDPGREPLSYAITLVGYAEVLAGSGHVRKGQERFAQALILGAAAVGGRFERSGAAAHSREGEEFLGYLARRLDAPRVAAPDRALARALVAISEALPPPPRPDRREDAAPVGAAVPGGAGHPLDPAELSVPKPMIVPVPPEHRAPPLPSPSVPWVL
ncbi:AfsR/SARP family transcriptional regulator [Catenulispora subtropica]|uniref:OmpR/PhoB-type domain-containing protein n=1 Tax=Catenulispora subtropica TaxID=450798 RepID=A0ABN2R066_9ACTN